MHVAIALRNRGSALRLASRPALMLLDLRLFFRLFQFQHLIHQTGWSQRNCAWSGMFSS